MSPPPRGLSWLPSVHIVCAEVGSMAAQTNVSKECIIKVMIKRPNDRAAKVWRSSIFAHKRAVQVPSFTLLCYLLGRQCHVQDPGSPQVPHTYCLACGGTGALLCYLLGHQCHVQNPGSPQVPPHSRKGGKEETGPTLLRPRQDVAHISSAHLPLVRLIHMATPYYLQGWEM